MDTNDFVEILRTWSTEIELRTLELRRCARIWICIHFTIRTPILLLSAIATGLIALGVGTDLSNSEHDTLTIVAIVINSVSIFLTGIDTALGAHRCATASNMCARQYSSLSNEMNLDIDELSIKILGMCAPGAEYCEPGAPTQEQLIAEFRAIRAKYVPKQQAILRDEPNNLFFRRGKLRKHVREVVHGEKRCGIDPSTLAALQERGKRANLWRTNHNASISPISSNRPRPKSSTSDCSGGIVRPQPPVVSRQRASALCRCSPSSWYGNSSISAMVGLLPFTFHTTAPGRARSGNG